MNEYTALFHYSRRECSHTSRIHMDHHGVLSRDRILMHIWDSILISLHGVVLNAGSEVRGCGRT
jgi:hypothetical protein